MKFDIIIANPPYHTIMNDKQTGLNGATYRPIYQTFIDIARRMNPRFMAFIVPARWFTEGRHLENWSPTMINDNRIAKIVDYVHASKIFSSKVDIAGGCCYFLWDRNKTAPEVEFIPEGNQAEAAIRVLNKYDIIIRDNKAPPILEKVLAKHKVKPFVSATANSHSFFNIPTDYKPDLNEYATRIGGSQAIRNNIPIYSRDGISYIDEDDIPFYESKPRDDCEYMIDQWKVVLTKCAHQFRRVNKKVILRCDVLPPPAATTATFLIAGNFLEEEEAANMKAYLTTKFARFMLHITTNTQQITPYSLRYVPAMDYKQEWTDERLYDLYELTPEERAHIEKTISVWKDAPALTLIKAE